MKKLLLLIFISANFIACKAQNTIAQADSGKPYQTMYNAEKHETTLRGLLKRSDIEEDTTFSWFKKNYKLGSPDAATVNAFKTNASKFKMVIFGGTWCEDTQNILPQFFRITDAAGYADSNITLIGVDRKKTTLDNLNSAFHIINVPTFIIMKDGKEVGRVVEYGKSGEPVKELGEIVKAL